MRSIFIYAAWMLSIVHGNPDPEILIHRMSGTNNSLAKTSLRTSTVYTSTYFNYSFTCPSGWVISNFDSTTTSATFDVVRPGFASLGVYVTKNSTSGEARLWDSHGMWGAVLSSYVNSSNVSPTLIYAKDTSYSTYHAALAHLRYTAPSGTVRRYDIKSESRGVYHHMIYFSTTELDYNANASAYGDVWLAMFFGSSTSKISAASGPATSKFSVSNGSVLNPTGERLEFLNLAGKTMLTSSEPKITIPLNEKVYIRAK